MSIHITNTAEDTYNLGIEIAKKLVPGDVVAMTGDLGAGKTVFVKGAATELGYTGQVTSPTFALVNEYDGRVPIYHFDMYRIQGEEDLYSTGFYDYLDGRSIMFIEWSENVMDSLPKESIRVDIKKGGDSRIIQISGLEGR